MKVYGLIPARMASSRLPGKPLALIGHQPMILHVVEKVSRASGLEEVRVITDDEKILKTVESAGFKAALSPVSSPTGTDRLAWYASKYLGENDGVINIQGDEPFIHVELIEKLSEKLKQHPEQIITAGSPFVDEADWMNPNSVKALVNRYHEAMWFSRAPLPFSRSGEAVWHHPEVLKHHGLYGYSVENLKKITALAVAFFEESEQLEQLRWLHEGLKIRVIQTDHPGFSVDTPNDLKAANAYFFAQHGG